MASDTCPTRVRLRTTPVPTGLQGLGSPGTDQARGRPAASERASDRGAPPPRCEPGRTTETRLDFAHDVPNRPTAARSRAWRCPGVRGHRGIGGTRGRPPVRRLPASGHPSRRAAPLSQTLAMERLGQPPRQWRLRGTTPAPRPGRVDKHRGETLLCARGASAEGPGFASTGRHRGATSTLRPTGAPTAGTKDLSGGRASLT
jgi:hypothetical protein